MDIIYIVSSSHFSNVDSNLRNRLFLIQGKQCIHICIGAEIAGNCSRGSLQSWVLGLGYIACLKGGIAYFAEYFLSEVREMAK